MTSSYGQICGALFVGTTGKTLRCYSKGQARYGGRCKEHERLGEECSKPRRGSRCGYRGETHNGFPCQNGVAREGNRCGRHTLASLAKTTAIRAVDLREKLAELEERQARTAKLIERTRATLARLSSSEAAE